jgi:hypothetical protein
MSLNMFACTGAAGPSRRVGHLRTLIVSIAMLAAATSAQADDFVVYSPYVTATQSEIEFRGFRVTDGRAELGGTMASELSIAHGVNGWWKPELYLARLEKQPGSRGQLLGYELENTFQLTPQGKYWADIGFLAAYEHNTHSGSRDAIEFGPLIAKQVGRFSNTLNLLWEKQLGSGASGKYALRYSYSSTYAVSAAFRPGMEVYLRPGDHAYQAGPIITGEWHVPGSSSNLEYRVGVVVGINAAAPRQTWLAQVEYEFL